MSPDLLIKIAAKAGGYAGSLSGMQETLDVDKPASTSTLANCVALTVLANLSFGSYNLTVRTGFDISTLSLPQ